MDPKIIYTYTDEAPMLATHAFLPILQAFSRAAGVDVETRDISLAGRILAGFPEELSDKQRVPDALAELGELVHRSEANIIKLPNISASIPQIQAAVRELQEQGFRIPDFPAEPETEEQRAVRDRYERVKGSAVNPVLREGNSDRRAASAVKAYARSHPHSMGDWSPESRTHVSSMSEGDFYGSERSVTIDEATEFRIEFVDEAGTIRPLRPEAPLEAGEILDAAVMSRTALRSFLEEQIDDARKQGVLFSLHLKATMMKVSDPVIFGHAVTVFFRELFEKHADLLESLGVDPDHGLGDLASKIGTLDADRRAEIEADLAGIYRKGPDLAMVDSDRGITNLHVPSDVIIDASMPAAIRIGGKMWGPDGAARDMKAVIPDRCYAGVYQTAIDFCRTHGAFDPATMGGVSNVGLMARKAEEYGSHDKTFVAPAAGRIRAVDRDGRVLIEQPVETGDIFRMCQTKDDAVRDWVKLALKRARATGAPAIFWLDENRAHDARLIRKIEEVLQREDTSDIEWSVAAPAEACLRTLERVRAGQDTISVTGNVLRDYLTDLLPILELGTSAKMLSIVPLMQGGGLFETGAGGSAPKHVQQLLKENHLRWDSLGEYLALTASFEHLAGRFDNRRAAILGRCLDAAVGNLLDAGRSPSRKCGELDNRGSHVHLARYWARHLAAQDEDPVLARRFAEAARALDAEVTPIVDELNALQGAPADIGGYYHPDPAKVDAVMRPSPAFNRIIADI